MVKSPYTGRTREDIRNGRIQQLANQLALYIEDENDRELLERIAHRATTGRPVGL